MTVGVVHEDPPQDLGRRAKNVRDSSDAERRVDQPNIGLMDQGRRIERLARPSPGPFFGRQSSQLFVDKRQKLFGCLRIALLDCGKDSRDVGHIGPEGALERSLSIAAYDLPNPLPAAYAPHPTRGSPSGLDSKNVRFLEHQTRCDEGAPCHGGSIPRTHPGKQNTVFLRNRSVTVLASLNLIWPSCQLARSSSWMKGCSISESRRWDLNSDQKTF